MCKIRYRIALLIGGTVLVLLLIIMAVFHLNIRKQIAEQADACLKNADSFSMNPDEAFTVNVTPMLYNPEQILIAEDETDNVFTQKERDLIEWCSNQPKDQTLLAELNGSIYYIYRKDCDQSHNLTVSYTIEVSSSDESAEGDPFQMIFDDSESITDAFTPKEVQIRQIISYVDVTGELDMIRRINLMFIIAASVIGMFGTVAGYILGKKLEQNQLVQKQFFENPSHELKTPLTAIRGYAEGISQGVITDYVQTGKVLTEQTDKMRCLIEDILCMAKLESGTVQLRKEEIGLPGFLQDCLMPFEGTVLNRGLDVSLELQPMTVSADPDQLEHALTNLLTNAMKYAKTGIGISCGKGIIRIQNDCDPLSDDELAHLFDRFYTGRGGNTGIGLSIARDYILLHGWHIAAERTENGICFVIRCAPNNTKNKKESTAKPK